MSLPKIKADKAAPAAFDDRSLADVAIDTAAAGVRGALMAYEAEFDGQMDITLEILVRATTDFLDDVEEHGGKEAAERYARRLVSAIEERK